MTARPTTTSVPTTTTPMATAPSVAPVAPPAARGAARAGSRPAPTGRPRGAYLAAKRPCDVVVVGARCAGAATALLLARAGLRVLLLDRAAAGSDTLCTHALMRGAVLQLHRWGLLDTIIAAGTPPVRSAVFRCPQDDVRLPVRPTPGVAGLDALYAPRRTLLDAALADAARRAGAEVRFGMAVTRLLTDGAGRVVGVAASPATRAGAVAERAAAGDARRRGGDEAGSGQAPGPREFLVRAALTIGADGAASTVARAVRAPARRVGPAAGSYLYGYWRGLPTDGYEWFYGPGSSAGLVPTNDELTCLFAGRAAARMRPVRSGTREARTALDAVAAAAAPGLTDRLAGAEPVGRVAAFTGRGAQLRQAFGPGWALAGDAGLALDPLGVHGISDALRDAELLARAVVAAGPAPGPGLDAALGRYQQARDRLALPMLAATDRLATHAWHRSSPRPALHALYAAMDAGVDALLALPPAPWADGGWAAGGVGR